MTAIIKEQKPTYKEGQNAYLKVKDMLVQVRILKVVSSYGRIRYEVKPIAGKGVAVVENLRN